MDNRNAFLSKVALLFIVYFGFCLLVTNYIYNNLETARESYIHARLDVSMTFYLVVLILVKIVFSLFGNNVKKLAEVLFVVDLYFTYVVLLGMFFALSNNQHYYTNNSYYLIISCNVLFYTSIAFFLSTFKTTYDNTYNFVLGFVLMTVATLLSLYIISVYFDYGKIGQSTFFYFFAFHTLINLYIALNSHQILTVRNSHFYDNEYFYCYMHYWGDWFSNIWVSMIQTAKYKDLSQMKRVKQKILKNEKRRRET